MISSGYTLALYCERSGYGEGTNEAEWVSYGEKPKAGQHRYDEFPHEYLGEHGSRCRAEARAAGWAINMRHGKALCPSCVKAGFKLKDFIHE